MTSSSGNDVVGWSVTSVLREPPPAALLEHAHTAETVAAFHQFTQVAHEIRQAVLTEVSRRAGLAKSRTGVCFDSEGIADSQDQTTNAGAEPGGAAPVRHTASTGPSSACTSTRAGSDEDISSLQGETGRIRTSVTDVASSTRPPASNAGSSERPASFEFEELAGAYRLLRFLQGYDFDVGQASEAYRRHLAWRASHGMDADFRRFILVGRGKPSTVRSVQQHSGNAESTNLRRESRESSNRCGG